MSSHLQKVEKGPLICPICLDIPAAKVFQCKNGHTICETCSINQDLCPTCRVPFGGEKIRNRALEDLIEGMEISCKHKEAGCAEKIIKRGLPAHLKVCKFRPINICKHLGYDACSFACSRPSDLFQHLVAIHNLEKAKKRAITQPRKISLRHMKMQHRTDGILMLGLEIDPNCMILEIIKYGADKDEFTTSYVHFGDADHCPYLVRFQITTPDKGVVVSWIERPDHVRFLENTLASPPVKLSGRYMLKNLDVDGARARLKFISK